MAKSELITATERFRRELEEATAEYEANSHNLKIKARRTRMTLDDMDVARAFVIEAYQILSEYYAACETIVRMLDSACSRQIGKAAARDVRAVVELIQEVNEATDSAEVAFDVVLDGRNLGDIGALKPVVSIQARMIQKTWESHYRNMPGYAQDQQYMAKQEREKVRKTENAAKNQENQIEAQKIKNQQNREEAARATNRCMEMVEQFERDVDQALGEIHSRLLQEQEETRQKLIAELRQMQQELDSLGFFAFSAKKELKQRIAATEQRASYVTSQQFIDDRFDGKKHAAENVVKAYRETVEAFCQEFDTVRISYAQIPSSQKLPSMRLCTPEEAEVVQYIQSFGGRLGWRDLKTGVMSKYTSQKAGMMLRRLTNDLGFLVREDGNRDSFYRTVDTPAVVEYEVVELNRAQLEAPCPNAPDIRSILG